MEFKFLKTDYKFLKMKNNLIKRFLEIHYFGQKIGRIYFVNKGTVSIIFAEVFFISLGLFGGIMIAIGIRSPLITTILAVTPAYIIANIIEKKLLNRIDFEILELSYQKSSRIKRILYFVLSVLMLISSLALMLLIIKILATIRY